MKNALGILLLFLALNAFGGGYYGMAGAKDVPVEWLEGSPFNNYFLPALILFVIVGGSSLTASLLVFRKHKKARTASFISAAIVLGWIVIQVAIIGYVSWMQPAIAILGCLILLLTYKLPK